MGSITTHHLAGLQHLALRQQDSDHSQIALVPQLQHQHLGQHPPVALVRQDLGVQEIRLLQHLEAHHLQYYPLVLVLHQHLEPSPLVQQQQHFHHFKGKIL